MVLLSLDCKPYPAVYFSSQSTLSHLYLYITWLFGKMVSLSLGLLGDPRWFCILKVHLYAMFIVDIFEALTQPFDMRQRYVWLVDFGSWVVTDVIGCYWCPLGHCCPLYLSSSSGLVNIMNIYAPTLCSFAEVEDQFYEDPDSAMGDVPVTEELFILDDFSSWVRPNYDSWPICIGHFIVGKITKMGKGCWNSTCIIISTLHTHLLSLIHATSCHGNTLGLVTDPN